MPQDFVKNVLFGMTHLKLPTIVFFKTPGFCQKRFIWCDSPKASDYFFPYTPKRTEEI